MFLAYWIATFSVVWAWIGEFVTTLCFYPWKSQFTDWELQSIDHDWACLNFIAVSLNHCNYRPSYIVNGCHLIRNECETGSDACDLAFWIVHLVICSDLINLTWGMNEGKFCGIKAFEQMDLEFSILFKFHVCRLKTNFVVAGWWCEKKYRKCSGIRCISSCTTDAYPSG